MVWFTLLRLALNFKNPILEGLVEPFMTFADFESPILEGFWLNLLRLGFHRKSSIQKLKQKELHFSKKKIQKHRNSNARRITKIGK